MICQRTTSHTKVQIRDLISLFSIFLFGPFSRLECLSPLYQTLISCRSFAVFPRPCPTTSTTPNATPTSKRTMRPRTPASFPRLSQGAFAGVWKLAVPPTTLSPQSVPHALFTGTVPVSHEDRRDTQFYKVFFVWFSMNFNILSSVAPPTHALSPF